MKAVFLVGVPRSGTTWLQLLLSQHPAIATAQETHVADAYLAELDHAWAQELDNCEVRRVGLRGLLHEAEFDGAMAHMLDLVLAAILARKAGATIALEKTPAHLAHWSLLHRVRPEARFIHVLRDPRAVTASLMRAARSWAGPWAPRSAIGGAVLWREGMRQRQALCAELEQGCHEVRYEALRRDPMATLARLYRWLGVDADEVFLTAAVARCTPEKLADGRAQQRLPWDAGCDPDGFYRSAALHQWRSELSRREVRLVEHICSEAMDALGYRPAYPPLGRTPPEIALRRFATAGLAGLARLLKRRMPRAIAIARRAIRE